jgi:hypothetical protein
MTAMQLENALPVTGQCRQRPTGAVAGDLKGAPKMRKTLITIALGLSFNVADAAGFMPWAEVFTQFDANADRGVSLEEAKDREPGEGFVGCQPFMVDHCEQLDANGDGVVMQDELPALKRTKAWDGKQMMNQCYQNTGFMATNPENQSGRVTDPGP